MKTVSVSFQNRKTTLTAVFDVYARTELSRPESSALITANSGLTTLLLAEDWDDEDSPARVEKQAARLAGLENKDVFLVRKSLK